MKKQERLSVIEQIVLKKRKYRALALEREEKELEKRPVIGKVGRHLSSEILTR